MNKFGICNGCGSKIDLNREHVCGFYQDKGQHDCCTLCGKSIEFISEETKMMKSGNVLYPKLMPMKERKTKIKTWICLHCGEEGKNLYLMEDMSLKCEICNQEKSHVGPVVDQNNEAKTVCTDCILDPKNKFFITKRDKK